jgi:hypothetical protein
MAKSIGVILILNYRIAGFSVPENTKAASYLFQIAKGDITNEQAFSKAVLIKHKTDKPRDVEELPLWGKQYTWRVVYCDKTGKEIANSGLHHFATGNLPYTDTTKNGLIVLRHATDHKDLFVLVDRSLVMYDMNGNAVWYMPDIPEIKKRDFNIRDFKATPFGTFTFLSQEEAIEVDYNGKVIWKGPNDGKVSGKPGNEGYHHEFTRLSNGHYMVSGSEIATRRIPGAPDTYVADGDTTVRKGVDGNYYRDFTCGTLIEYDKSGNVVWSWRTAEHLNDGDFFWPKATLAKPYDSNPYLNGFEVDEVNKAIYVSYKSINRVIKIAYPGGELLNSYGETGNGNDHNSPFYGQHSCRINPRTGELCVYNNNHSDFVPVFNLQMDADGYVTSHIVKYKMPPGRNNDLIRNWDVGCRMIQDKNAQQVSVRGGSVSILDDDCLLVSMGTMNLLMILDKQKQKIWEAVPYTTENNRRAPLIPYRCSYLYKKNIEKFLFTDMESVTKK